MESVQNISALKDELAQLKKEVMDIHQRKETAFHKNQELRRQIISTINEFRQIKNEVVSSQKEKDELKKQRDELNSKGRELITHAKQHNQERIKLVKKQGVRINPEAIRAKIAQIQTKIETEAIKFTEEKKLMLVIKDLKKKIEEAAVVKKAIQESREVSKDIDKTREQADSFHQQLYLKAGVDKEKYKKLKELSKQIKNLKKEQEMHITEYMTLKKEFAEKNEQLKGKLQHIAPLMKEHVLVREQRNMARQQDQVRKIAALEMAVEEKLRTKKKLTNEDLLVFQKR